MVILSVNAGSSSLKVAVFDEHTLSTPRASLAVEEIGAHKSFTDAIASVTSWLTTELSIRASDIKAVGHRVVHGGDHFSEATMINDAAIAYLTSITPLAPNHMPAALAAIAAFRRVYPQTPQVACFDTAFFSTIPEVAHTLPLPKSLGMRRYGFHGLSYTSLLESFREHEGELAARGRVIMAHLGSGASIAALNDGQPIDMSMGFTPVSGLMMSTRSGDLEPGVLTYLQREKGLSVDTLSHLVTYESGLLGVSGKSGDMHTLLQSQHDSPDAALAIELFCYKAKKQIGAFAAALGGVDSIIFSGGIGERSAEVRRRICSGLEFLGVTLDEHRNEHSERLISAEGSQVGVHVIQTKEDVSIVTQTYAALQQKGLK